MGYTLQRVKIRRSNNRATCKQTARTNIGKQEYVHITQTPNGVIYTVTHSPIRMAVSQLTKPMTSPDSPFYNRLFC